MAAVRALTKRATGGRWYGVIDDRLAGMSPAKNPWWQATKTPKSGFILGGWWLLVGAYWIVEAITEPGWASVSLAVLAPMLGSVYLASAVLLRRRQRSGEDSTWHGSGHLGASKECHDRS